MTDLPTSGSYTAFNARLADRYGTYENLPKDWCKTKTSTSRTLATLIDSGSTVLSLGCGIGFVEYDLALFRPDLHIFCSDFADPSGPWAVATLDNVKPGWTLSQGVESGNGESHKFDVIYLCQVLYALPSEEAITLLAKLATYLTDGGLLILVNSSVVPEENGQEQELRRAVGLRHLSQFLAKAVRGLRRLVFARTTTVYQPQFWGWQRDNWRYQEIVTEAGLKSVDVFPASGQSFLVATN